MSRLRLDAGGFVCQSLTVTVGARGRKQSEKKQRGQHCLSNLAAGRIRPDERTRLKSPRRTIRFSSALLMSRLSALMSCVFRGRNTVIDRQRSLAIVKRSPARNLISPSSAKAVTT